MEASAVKYHVVRLDYGIHDAKGRYHQTHHFSAHKMLSAAIASFLRVQKKFNCVDIVDQTGQVVEFDGGDLK